MKARGKAFRRAGDVALTLASVAFLAAVVVGAVPAPHAPGEPARVAAFEPAVDVAAHRVGR